MDERETPHRERALQQEIELRRFRIISSERQLPADLFRRELGGNLLRRVGGR
jgi:hypothetical protein